MESVTAEILLRPEPDHLKYLPEGPLPCGDDQFTWVCIQHAPEATTGSLNRYRWSTHTNETVNLNGRPGFAIPAKQPDEMWIGLERCLVQFRWDGHITAEIRSDIEQQTDHTIINDGVACRHGLIFGCKDLEFADYKAGLYFWRESDGELFQLRDDQLCSNGKVILSDNELISFLDIDTPTRRVVRYELDPATGSLSAPETVLDLSNEPGFPDGMIATPDGQSVIIALFQPDPAEYGQARCYDLETGNAKHVWTTPGSPQVTCPMLQKVNGEALLVLTTAAENMDETKRSAHPNAGCLFVARTNF